MQYAITVSDSLASLLELIAKSHGVSVEGWIEAWLGWWVETSRGSAFSETTGETLKKGDEFRQSVALLGPKGKDAEA